MQRNLIIVVLVSVIFQCNGHLPSLTGILTGAHKHVHDTVHGVANTVLGAVNFDGHVQIGSPSRRQPPRPSNGGQEETIIVIVDETPDHNHGPGPQNRPIHGNGQYNGYNNRPPPHGHNQHGQGRPWQNQNGNYNNAHGHYEHQHNNYGQNPNNYGNHNGHGNHHNGNQNQHADHHHQNGHNRPEQTTQGYGNQNNGYNNRPSDQSNNGYTNQNSNGQTQSLPTVETRPTFASNHENDGHTQRPYKNDKSTTTDSDLPQFVPLNPNEYVYGGSKINVTAPKRDTDSNKPASDKAEDDYFPIDIRFQDN